MPPTLSPLAVRNDAFRARLGLGGPVSGRSVLTAGVAALGPEVVAHILATVAAFTAFTTDNDPYGEHDFGAFDLPTDAGRLFWKIDYYEDATCTYGAEDPLTAYRVLTVMLASEY